MSDDFEADFSKSLAQSKWRYETQGLRASDRAYEYGVLVVKNAMLVSGGGLFFIPTMVGLSAAISLDWAFLSGMLFGLCVLLTLVANYFIHWNWMLLERSWDDIYGIEQIEIRASFGREFTTDKDELAKLKKSLTEREKWISGLFYGPHVIAVLFVIMFGIAAYCLYEAFFSTIGKS